MLKKLLPLLPLSIALSLPANAAMDQWVHVDSVDPTRDRVELAQRDFETRSTQASAETVQVVMPIENKPKHPNEAKGPRHNAFGVIHQVSCSYPQVIEFHLEGQKAVSVYNNNFSKIDLTAIGFTPNGSMNPCKDFEGMKARIEYAESADSTVDGQVLAIELRK